MRPMTQPRMFRMPRTGVPADLHARALAAFQEAEARAQGIPPQAIAPQHPAAPPMAPMQPAPVANPGFGAGIAAGAIGAAAIGGAAALAYKSQGNKRAAACRVDGQSWWQSAEGQASVQAKMSELVTAGTPPSGGWTAQGLVAATVEALAPGCLNGDGGVAPLSGADWMTLGQIAQGSLGPAMRPGVDPTGTQQGTIDPRPTIPGTTEPNIAEFQPQEPLQQAQAQGSHLRLVATRANNPDPQAHPNWMPKQNLWRIHQASTAMVPTLAQVELPGWAEHKLNVARYKIDQVRHAVEYGQVTGRQKNGYMAPANAQILANYSAWLHDGLTDEKRLSDWMQAYISEAAHDAGVVHQYLQAQFGQPQVGQQRPSTITTARRQIQARRTGAKP